MTPRIWGLTTEPTRVTTAEAVITVTVDIEGPCVGAVIRGRLVGPRCPGVTTVEVAYPLRDIRPAGDNRFTGVITIPEPNLWTEAQRFRYEGWVELWLGEQRVDEFPFGFQYRASWAGREGSA
jgi:hypothetical protein